MQIFKCIIITYDIYIFTIALYITSLYEFIYTYRNNKTSPYPDIKSKETRNAFLKIKKLNNKLNKS